VDGRRQVRLLTMHVITASAWSVFGVLGLALEQAAPDAARRGMASPGRHSHSTLSLTVIDVSSLRDLHTNLAVVAVMFSQNDVLPLARHGPQYSDNLSRGAPHPRRSADAP
jgi:hypothetical protein